ncbi:fungal-specific transcription factor domain-containing protein [Lyophyllum atratum]|nr:fungal-specific transcription factor domain-containing protein [Lyophyllum atratum]
MATPPGEPSSAIPSSQPLPQQPLPPTPKPTTTDKPPTRKPRQRKLPQKQDSTPSTPQPYPPRGHILPFPPPPPPYHIMNPPYGSPYHPQQHYASQGSPGSSGQPLPGPPPPHHQYAYPMHYYPSYQYPGPMMMYPQAPRPSATPDTPHSAASPQISSAAPGGKRKRKSTSEGRKGDKSDDEGASGSDNRLTSQQQQQHAQNLVDLKKRTKTQRACDSCRSRKIRCDILPDAEPPTCQHCKQYGFEDPLQKKKLEEESSEKERAEPSKAISSPQIDSNTSVFGPTSTAHLLHSQATISSRIYENYDLRYNHTFEVSNSGDGLITVQKPASDEAQLAHTKPVDLRIERDVIEQLVNAYFTDVAPILPIVTKAEFLATPNPPPILLYSMCLVAAARREVPQAIFDSIRYAVNNVIKAEDVLSTASIVNVQALLILCMTGDCHSQFVSNALSALWVRLGTAIRMAQDLGLHRAESVKQNIEMRRRLWGACVISDRWTSLTYGHPYMIDVQDCDARLPSSGDHNDLYMDELVRLSVILGRVLKTIYSPSGLTFTTDDMLYALLADMETWKAGLPEHLKFRGPDTPRTAGLLHLLYSCVCMMFWRVFMRISYTCPAHLKFGLTVEQWSNLVALTAESIDWLDANDHIYDVWLLVAYAATSCALVQYHTWARRKDEDAAAELRKLRDTVRRWEGSISPDHMSARRKAEIISLLYEATQGPHLPMEAPALNPTGGVTVKPPVGLDYRKDPTRPGSGVFIAHGQTAKDGTFKDIPAGVIINSSSDSGSDLGETTPAPAVSSSLSAAAALNDRDRASLLSTSSSFAPPLPNDINASSPSPSSIPPMHRNLSMSSAMRSTVNQQQQQGVSSPTSPLVNFTPIGRRQGSYTNVNPAMNMQVLPQGNVQLMNVLDGPVGGNTLQEFAITDNGFLEGIPGGMFDWGQWDTFFSRFSGGGGQTSNGMEQNGMPAYQQARSSTQPPMQLSPQGEQNMPRYSS